MRVVIALGGNALLRRGEPMTLERQRANVRVAAEAIAPLAREHDLLISHGNGPQVGLLALQGLACNPGAVYPLDALGAETDGLIGYLIVQELGPRLPAGLGCVTVLTRIEVDAGDPAFAAPTKFIGPVYDRGQAHALAREHGWTVAQDGDAWRRVVPSPRPLRIVEMAAVELLVSHATVVICAGGGGIPVTRGADGVLRGADAVIDKDLSSALLAREAGAGALLLLTDTDAVYDDWGTPRQRAIRSVSPADLRARDLPAGSMGPKAEAACEFVEATGGVAAIGRLADAGKLVAGDAGTRVTPGVQTSWWA
jgi:carbamate kinase